ncbi:MAG: tRNA (N(6)-L-threonylcarbamoyladenosine(37)-C(2))-methylthiotransferase [Candidatus Bathyarchaeia archaeon]
MAINPGNFSLGVRGKRTVYIESYGCTANRFDLEVMLAKLVNGGYSTVDDAKSADVILINTCGVKKPTEDKILNRLRVLSSLGKPLIVAGCLPKINLKAIYSSAPSFSAAVDPYSVSRILEAMKDAESGVKHKLFFSEKPDIKLLQPKVRLNRFVEIVKIAEGCSGACSFCCVRFARGRLFSYPKSVIVDRIRDAVSDGAREIWITSQDNGAYGLDIGSDLAELLEECCMVEGDFLIRVGMMNPNHALRILDRLVQAFMDRKVFKFLHLPVQSGDDLVLRRMNRFYSVEDFKRIVSTFREKMPRITLSTDVICGFPGESEDAFNRTVELIKEAAPDIVNISKFFPRPQTPAAEMEQLPPAEVKNRSRRLTEIAKRISYERNRLWLGWKGRILIDEKGKRDTWVGRNYAYKPVVVRCEENLLGKFVDVCVVEAFPTYLKAEILE